MASVVALAEPAPAIPAPVEDRRLAVMRGLVAEDWLPGEWDPERLVLTPRRGSLLDRMTPCLVPDCVGTISKPGPWCPGHAGQFARSGAATPEEWIAAGGPGPVRRRLSEQRCVVTDGDGTGCDRPARDPWELCLQHAKSWESAQRRGESLDTFRAKARPLASYGPCQAACCYRLAQDAGRLCKAHYNQWIAAGCPRGRARDQWLCQARDLANGRVVSLRGLTLLARLEILYALQCRVAEQGRALPQHVRRLADEVRATGVVSITEKDLAGRIDPTGRADPARFARYAVDRVALAYADPEIEATKDRWDLRVFGRTGTLDFSDIRQDWLRDGVKRWVAVTMPRQRGQTTLQHRVRAMTVLSEVLASGPGGSHDPAVLSRGDVDRFLLRVQAMTVPDTGEPLSDASKQHLVKSVGLIVREAGALGFLPGLDPTFSFRRGDARWPVPDDEPGRALPAHVVAQLDTHLELLYEVPGSKGGPAHRSRGVLGDRIGAVAVLAYQLLKGTGRRLGEIASLRLNCLDVDETSKAVLVYDNHKAGRMSRRLPVADTTLVDAIRDQQRWVTDRFPTTPPERLWLLPRPFRNRDGTTHIGGNLLYIWIHDWIAAIPALDAVPAPGSGEPVPFDRSAITPHAFRHTYAQTLADQGVAPSVLRDLMDHRNINTTLGYYRVSETKKRDAMELLARHTIDNRGTLRPAGEQSSRAAQLREEISWVAVPMGKCSEPTNVRAGGQACPIRYQCAGCPHFESDPSYLPELRGYADELRKEREVLIAFGAAEWVITNVTGQLEVIADHVRRHEALLETLGVDDRDTIEEASRTVRKVRQSIPVAFGRRPGTADG